MMIVKYMETSIYEKYSKEVHIDCSEDLTDNGARTIH